MHSMTDSSRFHIDELEAALSGAEVGIWSWDIRTSRVRWSEQTERIFGLLPGAFAGTYAAYLAFLHPEDLPEVEQSIELATQQKQQAFRLSHRAVRSDGTIFFIESRGTVLLDEAGKAVGMLGTLVDATAAHLQQLERRREQERLRLLTELAWDYVYHADLPKPSLAPDIVAGSFERTTGYTPEQVAELGGWFEIVHPEDRHNLDALVPDLAAGRPVVNEYRILDKHGEVRWLRDRVRPINDPKTGELLGVYGAVQEITEQRKLEEQLLQAQKLDALARIAGGVAHDFNNLLQVIGLVTDGIATRARDGKPAEARDLEDLMQVTKRAGELTQSLLAFSRRQPSARQVLDLGALVESTLPMLSRAVGSKMKLRVTSSDETAIAWADPAQLQLVLLNLVMNARDAQPNGGQVRLEIGTETFEAGTPGHPPELGPGSYATLRVADDGVGMDIQTQRRIFEPFYSTKPPGHGTGLGLATAHGFLRQMGGAISVQSAPGAGTTFTIHLPFANGAPTASRETASLASVGGTERILVVEDEPSVLRLAARTLRDRGYEVVELASAEEALAFSDAQLCRFQLVLSDYRLTRLDGLELLAAVRERAPQAKHLLMSAFLADATEPLPPAADGFLAKPFSPDGLARRVRETLDLPSKG